MAPTGLTGNSETPNELQQIKEHIANGDNFLLSGGAGSGKTYTLVQVIQTVLDENPQSKVACMTYTNAAVKEIDDRVDHPNLFVSTIHDFLWDNIKNFQKELKKSLVSLINDSEVTKIKIDGLETVSDDYFDAPEMKGIQYKEYLRLREGIISHDELLILAHFMFKNYPKLSDVIKDRFKFIFIDEYQDTHKEVIEIFLDFLPLSTKKNTVGFFGDAMQSIYDTGVGNLNSYIQSDKVKEVKKEQNRRNPKLVIELANKLRTDGLQQVPSLDPKAPNMYNGALKEGTIKFIYSSGSDLSPVRSYLGWDFSDNKNTKELNLTHNLIVDKADFRKLMDAYDKDAVLKLKQEILDKIKKGDSNVEVLETDTFDEVVNKFGLTTRDGQSKKVLLLADATNSALYDKLKSLPFSEVRKIYSSSDSLLDDKKQDEDDENKKSSKRDRLIKHLFKIQDSISLYQENDYNEFIRKTDYQIYRIQDKINLKSSIEHLINVGESTIEEMISYAHEHGICLIDDHLEKFRFNHSYLYGKVKDIPFKEFQKLYNYLEGKTPYSTQHKTKGAEFNNVLVILDNGNWNNFNFENLFLDGAVQNRVLERTQKIFYVCCTRAKDNLAIFYQDPSQGVISKARQWFGDANVISL